MNFPILRILVGCGLSIGLSSNLSADPKASLLEWQSYNGDYGGTHYSQLDQINRDNVEELEVAWTWKSGDVGRTIECNPIIIDGVMFVTTPTLHVAALNAATGEVNWRFDPWNGEKGGGLNRGVAYWTDGKGDRRIFHSAGDHGSTR